ncbi:MAG TPA: hypothetical protein VK272_14000 [Solirubrobacteraceae bacterium]|nr:hypothetical protein [Solirubrobacteraceae bacterium]
MRSLQLHAALTEFIEAAGTHLHAQVAAGAEVQFELEPQRARAGSRRASGPTLYAYRALTGEFIAARVGELERLPSHGEAAALLEGFEGLERYVASMGAESSPGDVRARVRAAIRELLRDVFAEQTDFEVRPERLHAALDRLERSAALAGRCETTLLATLHGLTISSTELPITRGLMIAQPHALEGLPEGALAGGAEADGGHLVVALAAGEDDSTAALVRGRAVLQELLRALRLFGDQRVTLGALAWVRVGGGTWQSLALGEGGRPYGMLVVRSEQEDELRAFCNLVSRRAPHGNELAWALGRFELGCARESSLEALTDHLLGLRALLEPEGPASGLLPGRLAALCATPERRMQLTERTIAALALERDVVSGAVSPHAGLEELAREMANHLRALLRDVICGHLDVDLVSLADQLLLAPVANADETVPAQASAEQMLGDTSQSQEILDIFI